jgi:hypothetical protein
MKSLVRVFALLLLSPVSSFAQVAYDAVCEVGGTSVSSLSCDLTVAGSDRLVHQGVSYFNNSSSVSGGTYNAVATTEVPSSSTSNGNNVVHTRTLVAPATGTNACALTFGGSAPFESRLACTSYTGVDQSTPLGTANTATGSSTTPSVTVSGAVSDDFVVDRLIIAHNGTLTAGANQTERANQIGTSGFNKYATSTQDGADGGVMSWSNTSSQAWAITAVPIKAAGAAAATTRNRLLLGVGQ